MSKSLKSQVENRRCQLMGYQWGTLDLGPIGAGQHPPTPFPARAVSARATPRGGAPRAQGLPLAQRPAPLLGPREVRK